MDEQGARERIRAVPIFSEFGDKDLRRVAEITKEVRFPAGKVIAKQGESGVGFHVIVDGEVDVSVDGTTKATLRSGEYFGEMSLLDGSPRSATVTASTDLRTISVTSWDFNALLDQYPELARTLLVELSSRLRSAEHSVSQ